MKKFFIQVISGKFHKIEKNRGVYFYAYNQQQKTFKMKELSEATLTTVMQLHNITRFQARDLWYKLFSLNEIFLRKYDDTYMENIDTVLTYTLQYKQKVLDTYKKPISIEIEQEHKDEWRWRWKKDMEMEMELEKEIQKM